MLETSGITEEDKILNGSTEFDEMTTLPTTLEGVNGYLPEDSELGAAVRKITKKVDKEVTHGLAQIGASGKQSRRSLK